MATINEVATQILPSMRGGQTLGSVQGILYAEHLVLGSGGAACMKRVPRWPRPDCTARDGQSGGKAHGFQTDPLPSAARC
jgi:hypothetical protein